ncbi:MAG: hypothetical protein ACKO0Z_22410 [Betaproteobacteria bacterium]
MSAIGQNNAAPEAYLSRSAKRRQKTKDDLVDLVDDGNTDWIDGISEDDMKEILMKIWKACARKSDEYHTPVSHYLDQISDIKKCTEHYRNEWIEKQL